MNNRDKAIQNTVNKWIEHVLDNFDSEIKFEKCTLDETMDKYFHDLFSSLSNNDIEDGTKLIVPVTIDKDYICVTSYIDVSDRKHIVINTNSNLVVDVYVDRLKLNTVIYGIDNGDSPFPKLVDDVLNYIVYGKDSDTIGEIINYKGEINMNNHDEAIQNTVNKWIEHVLDITDSEIKFEKYTLDETMDKYFHDLISILLDTDKDDVEKAFVPVTKDKDYICLTSYIDVSGRRHIVINTNNNLVVDVYVDRLKLNTVIYGIDNGEAPFPKLVDDVLNYIVYGKDSDTIGEIRMMAPIVNIL